jgi:hypothetical protein
MRIFDDWIYDEMDGYDTFGDRNAPRMARFRQRIENYVRHLYANKLKPV